MLSLTDVTFSPKHLLSGGNKSAPKSPISNELAEAFSMDPSKSTQQPSSTSQKQPMSLEAKKRAVTEFEQLERMKQQPNLLTPQAAPTPKTKPPPTDLTGNCSNILFIFNDRYFQLQCRKHFSTLILIGGVEF